MELNHPISDESIQPLIAIDERFFCALIFAFAAIKMNCPHLPSGYVASFLYLNRRGSSSAIPSRSRRWDS